MDELKILDFEAEQSSSNQTSGEQDLVEKNSVKNDYANEDSTEQNLTGENYVKEISIEQILANQGIIEDSDERVQQALNDIYNYISSKLKENYYNYADLLNDKDMIIQSLLSQYNITNTKDILYIYNQYDYYYRVLKNQAEELKNLYVKQLAIKTELIGWGVIIVILFLILGVIFG